MKPKYEVYYGGLGCGKSSLVQERVNPEDTLILGTGSQILDWIYIRPGAVKKHRIEIAEKGFESMQNANPLRIVGFCKEAEKPVLLIDDWTTLYKYSMLWPPERISQKCQEVFNEINNNKHLERVIFVGWDAQTWLPFGLYKKRALWNKELFKVADEITKVEYGIPLKIK